MKCRNGPELRRMGIGKVVEEGMTNEVYLPPMFSVRSARVFTARVHSPRAL